jgi:hypothetical protein
MNAIGGFSAPLNGIRPRGYAAKMSSRQKQETRDLGGSYTLIKLKRCSKPGRAGTEHGRSQQ